MPTRITDVVVPEEFTAYTVENSMINTALFQSGVAVRNGEIESQLSAGAESFTVPFWSDLPDVEADVSVSAERGDGSHCFIPTPWQRGLKASGRRASA